MRAAKRDSRTVHRSIPMPAHSARIVLRRWGCQDDPKLENLSCIDPDGETIWRAALPAGGQRDCFVDARLEGEALVATTWTGFKLYLSPTTGAPLPDRPAHR